MPGEHVCPHHADIDRVTMICVGRRSPKKDCEDDKGPFVHGYS